MKSTTSVILLMFLAAFFHSSYSIKCYQCNSRKYRGCGITVYKNYLRDCPRNDQCSTEILYRNATYEIHRKCVPKEWASTRVDLCYSDRCNGNVVRSSAAYNNETSIRCYVCDDVRPQCENFVDDKYLKVCHIGQVCATRSKFDSDNNLLKVWRQCAPKDTKFISERYCVGDGCNGNII